MCEEQAIFCFAFLNRSRISVPCAEVNVPFPNSFSLLLCYLSTSISHENVLCSNDSGALLENVSRK